MSKISALAALAFAAALAPMQALPAEPMQDGTYIHYSPRTNHCYLIDIAGGDVRTSQTYYAKDCTGTPFADWPVTLFHGGWTANNQSWFIHGWTADSIDVRFGTPSGKAFDFRKR